ncbi:hypothetical protein AX15_000170 [Amanita polypyramis BW_CC]|nr:hypothetical protein AX15_000170 [Amanita polypyramis BW_CC]
MANSTPAAALEHSIISFSKNTLKNLKDLEKQLAQANTDARDAQKERDNALKLNHASQSRLEEQKQDILKYKASLATAELAVEHQADIIAQLQRDVNHWKEQARNWQEHFTRVEEERCSLSTKLDDILSSHIVDPVISSHLIAGTETPISRAAVKQTSTTTHFSNPRKHISNNSKSAIHSPEPEPESPILGHRPKIASGRRAAAQQGVKPAGATKARKSDIRTPKTVPNESPDPPLSRLVRRVQAVIHVKSEDEPRDPNTPPPDDILDEDHRQDAMLPAPNTKHTRAATRRKSNQVVYDDDEWTPDEEKSQFIPSRNEDNHGAASDDDDELMLGGEDTRRTAQTVATQPNKRRKLNNANNSTRQKSLKKG